LVEKRTAETEFWDNFIVLHAGDVNQNGPGYVNSLKQFEHLLMAHAILPAKLLKEPPVFIG
jgi:hypothetical protein